MSSDIVEFRCQGKLIRYDKRTNTATEIQSGQGALPETDPRLDFPFGANAPSKPDYSGLPKGRPTADDLDKLLPRNLRPYVEGHEWDLVRSHRDVKKFIDSYNVQKQSPEGVAAAAEMGKMKRDWYSNSHKAYLTLFGPDHAARVTALSSAFSTGSSPAVEARNAVVAYHAWLDKLAGTEDAHNYEKIKEMLEEMTSNKTLFQMVNANSKIVPAARVLAQPDFSDPHTAINASLRGHKTNSYAFNRLGDQSKTANDRWVGYLTGVNPKTYKNKMPYAAATVLLRQATDILNSQPEYKNDPWTPDQTQAASWSALRTLVDLSQKNLTDPWRTLQTMTHGDVAETEDFLSLVANDNELRAVLTKRGYGRAVKKLERLYSEIRPTEEQRSQGIVSGSKGILDRIGKTSSVIAAAQQHPSIAQSGLVEHPQQFAAKKQQSFTGPEEQEHWQAFSPNTDEGLAFEDAYKRVKSSNQAAFKKIVADVYKSAGIQNAHTYDAVGDWSNGAENSMLSVLQPPLDPEHAKYVAAWTGLLGQQVAVLVFHSDPQGPDSTYSIAIPKTAAWNLRQSLDKAGIQHRTIVPTQHGHTVVIYDQGGKLKNAVQSFAGENNATVRATRGTGEFVGGGSRTEARHQYREIIRSYEASHANSGVGAGPKSNDPDSALSSEGQTAIPEARIDGAASSGGQRIDRPADPSALPGGQGNGSPGQPVKMAERGFRNVSEAAFRIQGKVYPVGPIHDYSRLPSALQSMPSEEGWVTKDGQFVPRQEMYDSLKESYAARRSPTGGMIVRGVYYPGGETMPAPMGDKTTADPMKYEETDIEKGLAVKYGPKTAQKLMRAVHRLRKNPARNA